MQSQLKQHNLAITRAPLPKGAFHEDLRFRAQEVAEKALKAVHRYYEWTFEYIHDLEELVAGLHQQSLGISPAVEKGIVLTCFAWEARHSGLGELVTLQEYDESLRLRESVVT
jgi:hypothetical protein